jgi:hypothetical protein
MKAIPTSFAGVNFRSQLEARWAVMFTELEWTWDYEAAVPLNGYIADYLVRVQMRRPPFTRPVTSPLVLFEAKPIVTQDGFADAIRKIALSGWEHAAVVVCPTPWQEPGGWAIGMGTDRVERRDALITGGWFPVGITDDNMLELGGGRDIRELWRRAGNRVQWCPPVKA